MAQPPGKDTLAWPNRASNQRQHARHALLHAVRQGACGLLQAGRVDRDGAIVTGGDRNAHVANQLDHGADVLQPRHVEEPPDRPSAAWHTALARLRLGARYLHLTLQAAAAANA